MIEINGWVTLSVTTDGENNVDELVIAINQIKKIIRPLVFLNQIFEIKSLNGNHTLFIGLNHNHDNGYSDSVHKLLHEIQKIAVGSYGLVYIRNHEHEREYNNFKVLKLAKGKITVEDDKLLSPCNPTIED